MLEVAANGVFYTTGLSAKFRGNHVGPVARANSYNEEKLDFTTTHLLPSPCAWWLANEDRLLLILILQQAIQLVVYHYSVFAIRSYNYSKMPLIHEMPAQKCD